MQIRPYKRDFLSFFIVFDISLGKQMNIWAYSSHEWRFCLFLRSPYGITKRDKHNEFLGKKGSSSLDTNLCKGEKVCKIM